MPLQKVKKRGWVIRFNFLNGTISQYKWFGWPALVLWLPKEEYLPDLGFIQMYNTETGDLAWVDTSSQSIRQDYHQRFESHMMKTKEIFNKSASDLIQVRTDQSYIEALMAFFKKRAKAI